MRPLNHFINFFLLYRTNQGRVLQLSVLAIFDPVAPIKVIEFNPVAAPAMLDGEIRHGVQAAKHIEDHYRQIA